MSTSIITIIFLSPNISYNRHIFLCAIDCRGCQHMTNENIIGWPLDNFLLYKENSKYIKRKDEERKGKYTEHICHACQSGKIKRESSGKENRIEKAKDHA